MIEPFKDRLDWDRLVRWANLPKKDSAILSFFALCSPGYKNRCCELDWSVIDDNL
jgi:hypothetical protein